jgi:hypothetical protein
MNFNLGCILLVGEFEGEFIFLRQFEVQTSGSNTNIAYTYNIF